MPIKFRCSHCGQLLSISSRKAGREVTCPECVHRIQVPVPDAPEEPVEAAAPAPVAAAPPPVPAEAEDSGARLAIVRPDHTPTAQETREIWLKEVNPWLHEEDEEEEEFKFADREIPSGDLDMTPMVDVTFLLLIFFMITASFNLQKSMETTPPEPDDDAVSQTLNIEDLEENSIVVEIDNEDNLRVDDAPVSSIPELIDVLSLKISSEQKTELLIEADVAATHGAVVSVTDAAITAGMQKIRRTSRKDD